MDTLFNDYTSLNFDTNDFLKQIFESLYLTLIVDNAGITRYTSKRYAEMLGFPVEKMIGAPIKEFLPNTHTDEIVLSGKGENNVVFEIPDGRTCICNYIPIRDVLGNIKGVVVTSSLNTDEAIRKLRSEVRVLQNDNELYRSMLGKLHKSTFYTDHIIGDSPKIQELKNVIERIANTDIPVLLTGESGCGKEVFANAIHQISLRKNQPYIKINCAAIPKDLMESELFGYEGGSFSGALKNGRAGKFEQANNGTLLLDEIGELPLEMQAKLLRVLQEYEIERIGSSKPIPLNIRIICCTNQDLNEMVKQKKFRQDLLYRINIMHLDIPPLRERREDIPALCESFVSKINKKYKFHIEGISKNAMAILMDYEWPGNIRELQHTLERAAVLTNNHMLKAEDFSFLSKNAANPFSSAGTSLSDSTHKHEKHSIIQALLKCGGNKSEASRLLGISRSQLYSKIRKYHISNDLHQ